MARVVHPGANAAGCDRWACTMRCARLCTGSFGEQHMTNAKRTLLRHRGADAHARVTMVELFFDLVFVLAVTQLSHGLLEHLTPAGTMQTLLLFLAVWWLWIFTAWMTNWLDPDRQPVRLVLFALMLGGLLLSASIPEAFAGKGLVFGCV